MPSPHNPHRHPISTPTRAAPFAAGAPAGGWGSLKGLTKRFAREGNPISASLVLMYQNKPHGYACPSCAWAKPAPPHLFEFCENGAKATIWELTHKRATPDFFARHSVTELANWSDNALESTGRLTQPLRYDATTDHYVPVAWEEAFAAIGTELRADCAFLDKLQVDRQFA